MINLSDIEFSYRDGEFRLRVSDLEIERGTTAAVIGPSGTGKTTLLNLIAGITLPQRGRVQTNEVNITSLGDKDRRRFRIKNIGLVFQEFELLGYLSVLDNVLLPYRINPALSLTTEVRDRARELAETVGLADKQSRHVGNLSQGERQRVGVCRAILTRPALILADEPTGNLDPKNKDRVLDILFDYVESAGATLVTVTHDHDLLARFGRIIEFNEDGLDAHASAREQKARGDK